MKHPLAILLTLLCSACGGVMDYRMPPIEVRGRIVANPPPAQPLLLGVAGTGYPPAACEQAMRGESDKGCTPVSVNLAADGSFEATLRGGMRGCAYMIIPPLLDLFCDYKSYFVIGLPGDPLEAWLLVLDGDKAEVLPSEQASATPRSELTVSAVQELPAPDTVPRRRQAVTLEIRSR